jgi:hypothetical protein
MKMKMKIENMFNNKIVSLSTSADDSMTIKEASFELIHDRLFIVGQISKESTTNDWAFGRPCAIAWSSVIDFMVFDTESQYESMIEIAD